MMFYAALLQSTPAGLKSAWVFMARFLNGVPANRLSATALLGFVKNAGFMLHQQYRFGTLTYMSSLNRIVNQVYKAIT